MNMRFVEMTGATLAKVVNEGEFSPQDLEKAGVTSETIIRINEQGDIEVRRLDRWDVVGGLIGEYADRIRNFTGLDWAEA